MVLAALAASAAFWWPFLLGGALHGHDWGSHHWNYFDWVRASIAQHGTLPLFMNDAWITKNFLANAEAPSLGPLVPLLGVLSTDAYVKLLVVVFSAAGLAGAFLLLRDLGANRGASALGAVIFAWNGFFVSHIGVGHHWAMGALLLPGLVLLFRAAVRGSRAALVAAAILNAFTIGGGQHQPFIWQNVTLAIFALTTALSGRAVAPLRTLALLFALTFGIGAVKLLPMWAEFAAYDPTERTVGLPLSLLPASLLARGQGPDFSVAGLDFPHGGGWWEYAFYVGPMAALLLVAGAIAARRGLAFAVVGGLFFVLAIDWPVWTLLSDLPVARTQRSPSRFLFLALFGLTVVAALGLDRIFVGVGRRASRAASLVPAALALAVALNLHGQSLPWQRGSLGEPLAPRDHRPQPLTVGEPGRAQADLVDFAPNRLVYRVRATEEAQLVFPFRNGEGTNEWRVAGLPSGALPGRTPRGKLALDVPPGERELVMVYRPKHFHAGATISAGTLLALGAFTAWRFATSRP